MDSCRDPSDKDSPAVKYIRIGYMQNYESASTNEYMYHMKCGDRVHRRNTMARLAEVTKVPREKIAQGMIDGFAVHDGEVWEIWLEKH